MLGCVLDAMRISADWVGRRAKRGLVVFTVCVNINRVLDLEVIVSLLVYVRIGW